MTILGEMNEIFNFASMRLKMLDHLRLRKLWHCYLSNFKEYLQYDISTMFIYSFEKLEYLTILIKHLKLLVNEGLNSLNIKLEVMDR